MGTEVTWQPEWAVPPGEVLLEALDDRAMTQVELARRIDRPLKTVNEVIKGKAAITPETAIQLERVLGISARVWNGLEKNYRESLAAEKAALELERESSWIDRFPIKDLARYGLINTRASKAEILAELLSFFQVSSPNAWQRHWTEPSASFRASPAFTASPEAVAAWLRWGEIEASKINCSDFNADGLRSILADIRGMTTKEPFSMAIERIRRLLAGVGVALVLTPELKGTHLSGAVRWFSSGRVLLQLSLRHKSDDQFWFSFFHELGHILRPGRHVNIIDSTERADLDERQLAAEEDADLFARGTLIPQSEYDEFVSQRNYSGPAIKRFSKELGVSTGIVVGRLQRDGYVPPAQLNSLKRALRWNG